MTSQDGSNLPFRDGDGHGQVSSQVSSQASSHIQKQDRNQTRFLVLFPKLGQAAGLEQTKIWLQRYEDAFPERDWEPFEVFRSFPLFLRNENRLKRLVEPPWVDLAQWEWAEFAALYHPVDERRESQSLKPGECMLNPTTQILRLETDISPWTSQPNPEPCGHKGPEMVFVYRKHEVSKNKSNGFAIRFRQADWAIAALLDPFLENGRMNEDAILSEIQQHHGTGYESAWRERIAKLIEDGLLLSNPQTPPL